MQKLRGEQTNIEEELLELQEGIEATANKVKHYVLRVLKTSLWDPRCQTYVFLKTKIP